MDAGTRSEVDDVIGGQYGLFIVFDNNDGIADVPEVRQCPEQSPVVSLMQSNRRFVENIHDTDQA